MTPCWQSQNVFERWQFIWKIVNKQLKSVNKFSKIEKKYDSSLKHFGFTNMMRSNMHRFSPTVNRNPKNFKWNTLHVIFYFSYSKSPLILIVTAKNSSAYSKEERRKRIDRRWTLFCARFLLLHKSRKEWSSDRERLEWHKRLISNPFGLKNSFAADAASKKAWFAIVMLSVTAARWCHIV